MARVTLYLRNGKEVDFETATFKPTLGPDNKLVGAEYTKKDKGMSLMFADWSEVVAITRDTRKDEDFQ